MSARPEGRGRASERPPRRPTAPDGFVVVDKPQGWTSHDVVARTRGLAGTRKVGHAGTLDPMATGVLVLGIGKATRLLTYVVGADKDYDATIRLGVATNTDDAEGETVASDGASGLPDDALRAAVDRLTGDIMQVPTTVSAIKIDGERAYARARAGEDVALAPRPVTVSRFDVLDARAGTADGVPVLDLDVRVTVSSGTYVRALARDLGAALGTGGHLTALRRTRVGGYGLDVARTLDAMEAQADRDGTLATLPLAVAARGILPVRDVDEAEARALGFGQWIAPSGRTGVLAAIDPSGDLVALVEDTRRKGEDLARPVLVTR
ncbi:tRNA pseudouridine(55) synthase TruB [Myceligenerans pegani]|uniref:tRNA pseudouridine synthase B n=1 Tax=Myceligenerans pegani TaxID=2776917 RepID=A0ABR9MRV2_9MICO|nr:tRNA pseudouridine(55) synthase TruB [Myceligenerans sp. TRM 65318]MBE1874110.1 tRNA pseudouridine(55) synthase TruB [Myceligenerans sp. TRM 65318]MBE3016382.1 tRNA pseudouridine(55) synthase TruB [Myceligenerans sp. TRM 65318]